MKTAQLLLCALTLIITTAVVTTHVTSQDEEPQQPDNAQMQQLWKKYSEPSEHNKKLDAFIGEWEQDVKMWWYPGAEPQQSKSTATYKWIMGGRFVQGQYSGDVLEQEFLGMDIVGYDNFRKQYISLWIDNMSTSFMTARGTMNAAGNELQMRGANDDIMTGEKDKPFKTVTRIIDVDTMVYEIHTPGPDGEFFKSLEVTSTRK